MFYEIDDLHGLGRLHYLEFEVEGMRSMYFDRVDSKDQVRARTDSELKCLCPARLQPSRMV